jgi:Flp pilus assembly protein TadD
MIERAVALRPHSGAVIDSLGWAHYRLGDYAQAVEHLERAVELTPADPTSNDHLGDVYWRLGRRIEARFQWQRALTLEPNNREAIETKLERGLSADTTTHSATR